MRLNIGGFGVWSKDGRSIESEFGAAAIKNELVPTMPGAPKGMMGLLVFVTRCSALTARWV
jgi:hypothetical protein